VTRKDPAPRKKRTRQHVIAAQSVNYVERFIIDDGHTAERQFNDYGYDLVLSTYDEEGFAEEGTVYLQLKSSEKLTARGNSFVFDMDVRDYTRWMREPMPVMLVLFDASKRRAYWLYIQRYFAAIKTIRRYKQNVLEQLEGAIDHA